MYIPKHFRMSDFDEMTNFLRANSFGILVSTVANQPFAVHLPLLYEVEQNVLLGHVAKANPLWENLDGQMVMAIFSGPHAYISPSWYKTPDSVPTWNYVAVHVYGKCSVIGNEEELTGLLEKIVHYYEPDSNLPARGQEPFYQNLMKAIVGFRIEITDVQGKAKLSQNKPAEVQERVITHLLQAGDVGSQDIAQWMQNRLNGRSGG